MKLILSFPKSPDRWPQDRAWHAQLSAKLYWGLKRLTPWQIDYADWTDDVDLGDGEYLVSFLPNKNYHRTDKIFCMENFNMQYSEWMSDKLLLHGKTYQIDDRPSLHGMMDGKAGAYIFTNDVALKKMAHAEPDVVAMEDDLSRCFDGNVTYGPHAIDREEYSQVVGDFTRQNMNMLIYHNGWRKNSSLVRDHVWSAGLSPWLRSRATKWIDKSTKQRERDVLKTFGIIASGSVSETGPINMLEFMHAGGIIFGHDAWWDGYGFEETLFSYDPDKAERNRANIRYLLNPKNAAEITAKRDRVLQYHLQRTDNTWDHVLTRLIEIIKNAT